MESSAVPKSPYAPKNSLSRKSILIGLISFVLLLTNGFPSSAQEIASTKKERPANPSNVAFIQVDGAITYQLHSYLLSRISRAKQAGVDLLIFEINSPGGLMQEGFDIANRISEIDWAHTVAYVEKEAISAAALISLGCDDIVLADKALFGDIGVIRMEADGAFRYIPAKLNSYVVQEARKLAQTKGRDGALAEAMIDKDAILYWDENPNDPSFEIFRIDEENDIPAKWKQVEESGKERFLTVTGVRAKALTIADSLASDRSELAKDFGFETDNAIEYRFRTTDSVVYWLNLPLITGLLVVIGLISLYIEFSAPGIGVGGLISGLCAALFFWSRFMGGTSGWLEVVLFLAGLVFLAFELFVIPGFGVSGLTGLLLIVASVLMASQDFVIPRTEMQANQVVTNLLMLLCSGAVVMVAGVFISKRLGRIPVFNRLVLATDIGDVADEAGGTKLNEDGKPLPTEHPVVSVGDWGTTESLLRPAGRARFNRVSFDVVSDGSFIPNGKPIKVVEISGNRIVVAEVDDLLPETTYPEKDNT